MAGKALERRKKEMEQEVQKNLRSLMKRTLQCYGEDERVERTLEATLRDIEFGQFDDSPTRRMPELLTQFGAIENRLGTPPFTS